MITLLLDKGSASKDFEGDSDPEAAERIEKK
jgi:hypothetical protein